jgi:hypothetical protein
MNELERAVRVRRAIFCTFLPPFLHCTLTHPI